MVQRGPKVLKHFFPHRFYIRTLLNTNKIHKTNFYVFPLFESIWEYFDPKIGPKKLSKGTKIVEIFFFCRFYTHMNPFKLLFDFLELNLRFFLI